MNAILQPVTAVSAYRRLIGKFIRQQEVFLAICDMDKLKLPPRISERQSYPHRQIILLAGCSSAEPASSSDLQMEDKRRSLDLQSPQKYFTFM
jgi:hypothetical protein